MPDQLSQAFDVVKVMPQDILKHREFSGFQIIEIALGHLRARQVAISVMAEYGFFKGRKIASLQAQLVYAPGCMQKVQLRHLRDGKPDPVHHHPGFQQRQVKRFAVEGHHCIKLPEKCGDFPEHRAFFAVIAHDILADHHAAMIDKPDPDFKCHRSCAAAQACRLRIQKQQAADIPALS